jgi:hypothetical protein
LYKSAIFKPKFSPEKEKALIHCTKPKFSPEKALVHCTKQKIFPRKKPCFFATRKDIRYPDARKTHISTLIFKFFFRARSVCPFSEVAPHRSRNPGSAPADPKTKVLPVIGSWLPK